MRKKKAQWVQHARIFHMDEYECSACGYKTEKPSGTCPHCGAEMKDSKYDPKWVDEMVLIDVMLDD